ncbi:MAG: hypothetical protein ACXWEY_15690, partial [Bacteroidia bacterium]
ILITDLLLHSPNGAQYPSSGQLPENREQILNQNHTNPMPQAFVKIIVHITFSTKNREPWITKNIQPELYSYIGRSATQWNVMQ